MECDWGLTKLKDTNARRNSVAIACVKRPLAAVSLKVTRGQSKGTQSFIVLVIGIQF